MLKKSGPNDIWLIGQGPSYTALCWSRSWPRISSLCEMQRQATVTKPLGSRACANRLAQFAPLVHRTCRACTAQSQGQALPLGTASAAPLPFAHYGKRSSKFPILLHTQLLWLHTHTMAHTYPPAHTNILCRRHHFKVRFNTLLASQQNIKLKSPFLMFWRARCFCA